MEQRGHFIYTVCVWMCTRLCDCYWVLCHRSGRSHFLIAVSTRIWFYREQKVSSLCFRWSSIRAYCWLTAGQYNVIRTKTKCIIFLKMYFILGTCSVMSFAKLTFLFYFNGFFKNLFLLAESLLFLLSVIVQLYLKKWQCGFCSRQLNTENLLLFTASPVANVQGDLLDMQYDPTSSYFCAGRELW